MKNIGRILATIAIGVTAAFAGPIQIGGVNGLKSTYIGTANANGTNGCQNIGPTATNLGCALGSTTGFAKLNYSTNVFGLVTPLSNSVLANQTGTATAATITELAGNDNVTFSMINEQNGTNPFNAWGANNGTNTLNIPIGIFGVNKVWTMISDLYGVAGLQGAATIEFVFGSKSNAALVTDSGYTGSFTVALNEGANNSATHGDLDILTADSCATINSSFNTNSVSGVGSTPPLSPDCRRNSGAVGTGSTLGTGELFNQAYNSSAVGNNFKYALGSSGQLTLGDQFIDFGSSYVQSVNTSNIDYNNLYLTMIKIRNPQFGNANANVGGYAFQSRIAVGAITVNSTFGEVPEPTSIALIAGGLLGLGYLKRRKA